MNLLQSIAITDDIMNRILIVGRLLYENRGIDTLVRFTLKNPELRHMIVCGSDVEGHQWAQHCCLYTWLEQVRMAESSELLVLILFLTHSHANIESFRKQIMIYDLIGREDLKGGQLATYK